MRISRLLAVFAIAALAGCTPLTSRAWELPTGVKAVRVNGYDMAYVERGSGVPLVLVHGAMSDFRFFAKSMDALATKHRVIAVSLRHYYPEPWDGHGDTFSMKQHGDDLAEFIKRLDAGPVHLFGHSRGGSVALHVARDNPQLLRSLVNGISGPGAWDASPDDMKDMVSSNLWTQKGSATEIRTPFECAHISQVRAPVLLMLGEQTSQSFRAMTDALQQCISKSQRAVIPNATHIFPYRASEAFAEALLRFTTRY